MNEIIENFHLIENKRSYKSRMSICFSSLVRWKSRLTQIEIIHVSMGRKTSANFCYFYNLRLKQLKVGFKSRIPDWNQWSVVIMTLHCWVRVRSRPSGFRHNKCDTRISRQLRCEWTAVSSWYISLFLKEPLLKESLCVHHLSKEL